MLSDVLDIKGMNAGQLQQELEKLAEAGKKLNHSRLQAESSIKRHQTVIDELMERAEYLNYKGSYKEGRKVMKDIRIAQGEIAKSQIVLYEIKIKEMHLKGLRLKIVEAQLLAQ